MMNIDSSILPDTAEILEDARLAIAAINKNSKLRAHFLKIVMMNNIMRAFVTKYQLDKSYTVAQQALLEVIVNVESRRDRCWFRSDKIILLDAYNSYYDLLVSATDDQLNEIMRMVDENRTEGKWLVYKAKH